MKIEKAPIYDLRVLEAARENASALRSEAAHDIAAAIGRQFRKLFHRADRSRESLVNRCVDAAKATPPLERGLRAGWY